MKYEEIQKVNSEIKTIDMKGKDYAMVPERVTAFRKLYPDGFITTDVISNDGTTVLMQSKAGYYNERGEMVILGTGFAQEVKGKGLVNGTSHIENCETSAVGRALGFLGLGINGGGICSAEELVNAITAQNQMNGEHAKAQTKNESKPVAPMVPAQNQEAKRPVSVRAMDPAEAASETAIKAKKEECIRILHQNAVFAYGQNADAKLNEFLSNFGISYETMTGPLFKEINKKIMRDIAGATGVKEGAA